MQLYKVDGENLRTIAGHLNKGVGKLGGTIESFLLRSLKKDIPEKWNLLILSKPLHSSRMEPHKNQHRAELYTWSHSETNGIIEVHSTLLLSMT